MLVGWNDLATVSPELAAQLVDPSIATTLTRGSSKKVDWFCEGTDEVPHPRREWSLRVSERSRGYGCAACAGKAVLVGWNDLATVSPELAAQLVDPTIATAVTRGSRKSVRWFCEGTDEVPHPRREWAATVADRSEGKGCAACAGREVLVGWNDLATVSPDLAARLVDPSLGHTVTRNSGKKLDWFCEGTDEVPHPRREWAATVDNRSKGNGCAACSGRVVLVGWNDLATVDPDLAAQLVDPTAATTVTRGSDRSVRWFCEGTDEVPHPRREWAATVDSRSKGTGCAACAGKVVLVGWNDLATVDPELAAQLVDPGLGQSVTRSSSRSVRWFCEGTDEVPHPRREWAATVANRSKGTGCAACAGQEVLVGWNDLATVSPDLAARLVDPSLGHTVTRSSGKKLDWFCEGTDEFPHPRREWAATVANRSTGIGCAACSGKVVLVGWNDLATVDPDLAAQLVDPSVATTLTFSANRNVRWFCEGTDEVPHPHREWSTTVNARSNGRGCAVCAATGYDPSKSGWLYFLHHDVWDMQQIGITNDADTRVGQHGRSGWKLVDIRKFHDGELCAATEQAGLRALRLRGARLGKYSDATDLKFDGYTEAWPIGSLELTGLQQLLDWVRDDEWGDTFATDPAPRQPVQGAKRAQKAQRGTKL